VKESFRFISRIRERIFRSGARANARPSKSLVESLEPRLLYSADLSPVDLSAPDAHPAAADFPTVIVQSSRNEVSDQQNIELIVLDDRVQNQAQLLADIQGQSALGRRTEILHVSSTEDGTAAITQAIGKITQSGNKVSAIHIVSHGSDGEFVIGNKVINEASLRLHPEQIGAWSLGLADGADLLIYGCDFASTTRGQLLAQSLAAVTGADVAGNSAKTGSKALGGDWSLDVNIGTIESNIIVSEGAQSSWQHLLSIDSLGSPSRVSESPDGDQSTGPFNYSLDTSSESTGGDKIAVDANGNYAVVWTDGGVIKIRFFSQDGSARTATQTIAANIPGDPLSTPAIAMNSLGETVVVWSGNAFGTNCIFGLQFDANGTPATMPYFLALTAGGSTSRPSVAINNAGIMAVAWESTSASAGTDIQARLYNPDFSVLSSTIVVNQAVLGDQLRPAIAMRGNLVAVTWHDASNAGNRIAVRTFNVNAGIPTLSNEVNANLNVGLSNYGAPDIAITTTNNIVVSWQAQLSGRLNTYFTIFDQNVTAPRVVLESQVNAEVGEDHSLPKIAALESGEFLIAQQSGNHAVDGNGWGVFARHFNAAGHSLSGISENSLSFSASNTSFSAGDQIAPNIAANNGKIVAAWTSDQSGTFDVFSRQYQAISGKVLVVDTISDLVDGDTSTVDNLIANRGADGVISLREAIIAANNAPNVIGVDRIIFNVPETNDAHNILLNSALPLITDTVYIDGAQQYNFDGGQISIINNALSTTPTFQFFGSPVGGNDSSGSYLSGLAIDSLLATAIEVNGSGITVANNDVISRVATAVVVSGFNSLYTINNAIVLNNIRGSLGFGVEVINAGGTQIVDNNFYANLAGGISLLSIGASTATTNNSISNNAIGFSPLGIQLSGSGTSANTISNNYIGVNRLLDPVANTGTGILINEGASANTVGGPLANEGNFIAYNNGQAIEIDKSGPIAAIDNRILGNAIYNNSRNGILVPTLAQVQPPTIDAVTTHSGITNVHGYLNGAANTHYRIEYFANPPSVGPNFVQGAVFLAHRTVLTDSNGFAMVTTDIIGELSAGHTVTTTATVTNALANWYGETSEFSMPTSVGIQIYQPENTVFTRDISSYTRNRLQPNLTYTLADVPDSVFFQLTPDGILSFAAGADFETMVSGPNGGDYSWWAGVIVSDGLQYNEYITHIFHTLDANDAPTINPGFSQLVEPGNLVTFNGSSAISISDPDQSLAAANTIMKLTLFAEFADVPGQSTGLINLGGESGPSVIIVGTLATLNGLLSSMTFQPDAGDTRTVRLFMQIDDNGSGYFNANNQSDLQWQDIGITAANTPPEIIGVPASLNFLENAAPIQVFGSANFSNANEPFLYDMIVRFPSPLPPGSTLAFSSDPGLADLTQNIDYANGIYRISGQASVLTYQTILRELSFVNTSENLSASSLIFTVEISNQSSTSAAVQTILQLEPINDAPTLSLGAVTSYTIGFNSSLSFGTDLAQALTIGDPDQTMGPTNFSLTLSIPSSAMGASFSLNTDAMQALVDGGLTVNFSVIPANTVFLSGNSALIIQAVGLITYIPGNGQSGADIVNFELSDLGNSGSGTTVPVQINLEINTTANTPALISSLNPNKSFTENGAVMYPLSDIQIGDAEQTTLTGATVILYSGFDFTQDLQPVFVNLPGQIQGSWAGNELTLTGTFPIATYKAALATIGYQNISESPSPDTRVFTVSVTDGYTTSNTINVQVTPLSVDDPTVISLPASAIVPYGQTIRLDNRAANLFLFDIDAGFDNYEMTLSVSDGLISLLSTTGISVVGSNVSGEVEIKLRGTIASLNFALQNYLQYSATPGFSSATLTAAVEAIDQGSGVTIAGVLTQASLNFVELPGTPIDIQNGSNTINFVENANPVKILPSAVLRGGNTGNIQSLEIQFTEGFQPGIDRLDVETFSINLATVWDPTNGKLTIAGFGSIAEFNTALQSVTFSNRSDNPTSALRKVSLVAFDGVQSSAPFVTRIVMQTVNDAPALVAPVSIDTLEDTAVRLSIANTLNVADLDSNQLSLAFVVSAGRFTWIGSNLTPAGVQSVSNQEMLLTGTPAEINLWANQFQFIAPENFSGVTQIQWRLTDDQGAQISGNTAINIAPINDTPNWTGSSNLSLNQGAQITLLATSALASDVEDSSPLLSYVLTAPPTHGMLVLHGLALQSGAVFTQDDINKGGLSYQHNNSANVADAFSFFVKDSSGAQTPTRTIDLAINPPPVVIVSSTGSVTTGGTVSTNPTTTITSASVVTSSTDIKSSAAAEASIGTQVNLSPPVTSVSSNSPKLSNKTTSNNAGVSSNSAGAGATTNIISNSTYSGAARATDSLGTSNIKSAPPALINISKSDDIRAENLALPGQIRNRSQSENVEYAAIIRTSLNSQQFGEDIQRNRDATARSIAFDKNIIASTTAVSTTLSVGYVVWLVRGGALLTSLLASIPAWRAVDPLPVLGTMAETEEDQDDDSLDAMIEKAKAKRDYPSEASPSIALNLTH
jgi:hypothetical protein